MTLLQLRAMEKKSITECCFRGMGKAQRLTELGFGGVSKLPREGMQVKQDLDGHRSGRQIFKLEERACVQAQKHEVFVQGAADVLVDLEVPVFQERSRMGLKRQAGPDHEVDLQPAKVFELYFGGLESFAEWKQKSNSSNGNGLERLRGETGRPVQMPCINIEET